MAAYTAIDDPEANFQAVIYTGNGAANHAITLGGDTDMQPDLVWIKNRDAADSHCLFDAARGATKVLHPDVDNAEATDADTLDSFTSDGFQVDADVKVNTNTEKYVAWNWKAGTTSGIATDGNTTITPSAYSFNQTNGFSVLKYTGNETGGAKVAHGLGATPDFILVKRTGTSVSDTDSWYVFHHKISTPAEYVLALDTDSALLNYDGVFNDTLPDSVNFTVGSWTGANADDGVVAYCFVEKQGYSKFGSYTGNGNVDGTFIYTGFKPAFLMVKRTNATENWYMKDNKRDPFNEMDQSALFANGANAEDTGGAWLRGDAVANGFKIRINDTSSNGSGSTYVYMAFAEAPFVNSNGVPCNAR